MAVKARWRFLVLACVLAGLLVPALASASTGPYAETRVRGLDLGNPASIRAAHGVTLGIHQGYGLAYDEPASGFLLAARGATGALRQVAIKSAHGARHLEGTGLASEAVESAITKHVQEATKGISETGSFWGRVTVEGQTIEYRAFTLPDGTINVGTYYPPVP
jgi:hypothetical protein